MYDAMHVNPGQVNGIGSHIAHFHHFFHFDHANFARHRRRRVEIAGGQTELQIAGFIRAVGFDQRHFRNQSVFHHIRFAIEFTQFFTLSHHRADTGFGEECGNAGATSTQFFRECALGCEFQLQFARQVLAFKLFVLAHIAGNHFFDLAGFQQFAQPKAVHACIIGNHGQIFHTRILERVNERLGDATQSKPAHGKQLSIVDNAFQRGRGIGIKFIHAHYSCKNGNFDIVFTCEWIRLTDNSKKH